jgi:hypothetical protein
LLSLVKAALTASGVAVTVGQARHPWVFFSVDGIASIIGKKMMSSGFLAWTRYSRSCTCGMPTLLGKQGSMAPRFAPAL